MEAHDLIVISVGQPVHCCGVFSFLVMVWQGLSEKHFESFEFGKWVSIAFEHF